MRFHGTHPVYIWQREGWPIFQWDSEALLAPVARISALHGRLAGTMAMLGFQSQANRTLETLTDDLIGSSEIEGVKLNPASVRSSIAKRLGLEDGTLMAEDHYVDGLVEVMVDAVHNCNRPLTSERIFGWHAALFPTGRSGMHRITVGDWRTGDQPMQVVSGAFGHEKVHYEAPPSHCVKDEMLRLIDWCNSSHYSPLIVAAVAHLWFVTVHPFDDGNGRLSRTLADMFLARMGGGEPRYYSMSAEINRNKKAYYEILERTQKGALDITPWVLWFLNTLEQALMRAFDSISTILAKAEYWQRFSGMEVNERQRKVINRLWDNFEGNLTSSKWAKICHCSQDTALRDINDLINKGMLTPSDASGRTTHYLLPPK